MIYVIGIAVAVLLIVIGGGLWYWQRQKLDREVEELVDQVEEQNADSSPTASSLDQAGRRSLAKRLERDGKTRQFDGGDTSGDDDQEQTAGNSEPSGHAIDLEPPDVSGSIFGLFASWRHRAKAEKLARRGYVKWYKIGARRHRPTWVKPELEGAGEPEYYDSDDEVTYLFPEEAMVPDGETGAWVAEHRVGEVEPINLREPMAPPLDADRLEEVINLEAESDAPGFFDRLDISTTTLMWMLVGGGFLVFAAMRYMG